MKQKTRRAGGRGRWTASVLTSCLTRDASANDDPNHRRGGYGRDRSPEKPLPDLFN